MKKEDVDKICSETLAQLGLLNGTRTFVTYMQAQNFDRAAIELEKIITLSVSRCINAVLEKNK